MWVNTILMQFESQQPRVAAGESIGKNPIVVAICDLFRRGGGMLRRAFNGENREALRLSASDRENAGVVCHGWPAIVWVGCFSQEIANRILVHCARHPGRRGVAKSTCENEIFHTYDFSRDGGISNKS